MQRFDADLKWTVGVVRSRNVPISNVDLTLALKDGRLALSPLTFAMARGNVASDVVFDTRARPSAVRYDIRLTPTPLGRLLKGYGVAEAGTTGTIHGRIRLDGRGDTIHDSLSTARGRIAFIIPQGDLTTGNAQLSELDIGTFVQKMFEDKLKEPVRINCGLVGFTVRGGVAAAALTMPYLSKLGEADTTDAAAAAALTLSVAAVVTGMSLSTPESKPTTGMFAAWNFCSSGIAAVPRSTAVTAYPARSSARVRYSRITWSSSASRITFDSGCIRAP